MVTMKETLGTSLAKQACYEVIAQIERFSSLPQIQGKCRSALKLKTLSLGMIKTGESGGVPNILPPLGQIIHN